MPQLKFGPLHSSTESLVLCEVLPSFVARLSTKLEPQLFYKEAGREMGKETMMTWMIANLQNGAGVPTVLVEKTTIYQQDGK